MIESRGYRLYPLAQTDLEDIWSYTAMRWSAEQAESYHAAMIAAFEGLATGSKQGRSSDVREGYFKYAVGSHLVFYQRSGVGIDIVRILHQHMDVTRHL
ncbi:MAG: type II toxin-antitoxin system RelE/ParE family toxin [Bosea sp.]|uniref:type II toxin-antitoxin system RelE/ParE family toxin n=1 Tax=Bosea sp. (in: a-proteobacteria) TaxID=1871050 RepID=UPI0023A389F9|nr:type II toxin-antitoxin system RelE/ParE family toxin [Bosea sp. (in: a-proteobacteria)]MCP4735007.1 type II toxin-antitoxin system RelE/ParE family toxin [Bosea sp. (in: a-proteobacteria)]